MNEICNNKTAAEVSELSFYRKRLPGRFRDALRSVFNMMPLDDREFLLRNDALARTLFDALTIGKTADDR